MRQRGGLAFAVRFTDACGKAALPRDVALRQPGDRTIHPSSSTTLFGALQHRPMLHLLY
jgi:hypothetical protein